MHGLKWIIPSENPYFYRAFLAVLSYRLKPRWFTKSFMSTNKLIYIKNRDYLSKCIGLYFVENIGYKSAE